MLTSSRILWSLIHITNYINYKNAAFETHMISLEFKTHISNVFIIKKNLLGNQVMLILKFFSSDTTLLIFILYSSLMTTLTVSLLMKNRKLKSKIEYLNSKSKNNFTSATNIQTVKNSINENKTSKNQETMEDIGVPDYIVNQILEGLAAFEKEKRFISKEISLQVLAKEIETNPRYLSKVINAKKGMKYTNYIKSLRIDYAKAEILENPKLRMYTIKAIADECGFKSSESFSKTFHEKHGIYPSQYIQEVNDS